MKYWNLLQHLTGHHAGWVLLCGGALLLFSPLFKPKYHAIDKTGAKVPVNGGHHYFAGFCAALFGSACIWWWIDLEAPPKHHHTAAVPTPKVTHTTIVQHITHVTQQVTQHGINGWLIAFIAAACVTVGWWLLRKLTGK